MNRLPFFLCLLLVLGIALLWPVMLLGALHMMKKVADYLQPFALLWCADYFANRRK